VKHNAKLLDAGAIGTAVVASICCLGPILLALLGLGGGALLLRFEPYRPYFLVATVGLLAGAFYLTYRPAPTESCEPGEPCAQPASRRAQKLSLWIVTVLVLLISAFPYYAALLF
jgi:mercuric ion transport protein